jgi:hypothetical protein
MNLGKPKKPSSLSEWLETATKGLAAPGRERITQEIKAHFAEAVEDHLAQGESETDAQTKALAEMGAPQVAALKFKEQYLTEADEKFLKMLRETAFKPLNSPSVIGSLLVLPAALLLECLAEDGMELKKVVFSAAVLATCILLPGICRLLAKRLSFDVDARWLLRIEVLRWLLLGLSLLAIWSSQSSRALLPVLIFYGTALASRKPSRLLTKLRMRVKPGNSMPTPA